MKNKWKRMRRPGRGQTLTELALIMPVLCMMLLGAVDYARVSNVQQRLEHAAHLATVRLQTDPTLDVNTFVRAESNLPTASAARSYSVDTSASADGTNQVVVTATYDYPLLLPGLGLLRAGALGGGKLRVSVTAAGIAATDPPSATVIGQRVTVVPPPTGNASPTGLVLTCRLTDAAGDVVKASPRCSSTPSIYASGGVTETVGPLIVTVSSGSYTATVQQYNGLASPPVMVTVPTPVGGS